MVSSGDSSIGGPLFTPRLSPHAQTHQEAPSIALHRDDLLHMPELAFDVGLNHGETMVKKNKKQLTWLYLVYTNNSYHEKHGYTELYQ